MPSDPVSGNEYLKCNSISVYVAEPHKFPLAQSNGLRSCFGTVDFLKLANFQVKAANIVVVFLCDGYRVRVQ